MKLLYIIAATLICSSVFWFLYVTWISRKNDVVAKNQSLEKESVSEKHSKNGTPA
jgi:hypothetical protein